MMRLRQISFAFLFSILLIVHFNPADLRASSQSPEEPSVASEKSPSSSTPWYENIEAQWGGDIKIRGTASWVDDESIFQPVGTGTFYDGNAEVRIKNTLFFGASGYLETHYEALISGGDTRSKGKDLEALFPDLFGDSVLLRHPLEDDRRFFDFTKTITENDEHTLYHRLDRLAFTAQPEWGAIRVGRQAITWGNGLVFNPMDLFNPFSPTDIERDYKIGDDLVLTQFSIKDMGDLQLLYVPRRNPITSDVEGEQSSLAGKFHFAVGATEFDFMAAKHFKDAVAGIGGTGYLADAAWRLDATWTLLDEESQEKDYLSLIANVDYSWAWFDKNFYGLVEFYYNGLGDDDYPAVLIMPVVSERLDRGELFVLGRAYLSGHIRVELHPLFNIFFTVINNLEDPSGVIQPWATWDIAQDLQLTCGANIYYGGNETEFGGFKLTGTDLIAKPADNTFLWLTYYF